MQALHNTKMLSQKGVSIVAIMLIVTVLSMIGMTVTTLVATGSVAKTNDLVKEQSFALIHAGFEYALKRLSEGTNPSGETKTLGNGQFTISQDIGTGVITVNSQVSAMQGSSGLSYSIQGPTGGSMADCLTIDVSGAYLSATKLNLRGITLQNTCQTSITISGMTLSWSPSTTERMRSITIGVTSVYNNATGVLSGTAVDTLDYVMPPCTSVALSDVTFSASMANKNFTLLFSMSDGTSKSAFAQFVTNNEAACLNVDVSGAYIGYTNYTRLLGVTLTNSCTAPILISANSMITDWRPSSPARRATAISIGGTVRWTGNSNRNTLETFSTPVEISGGQTVALDYITYNGDMRGYNHTLTFNLNDSTTKVATINLYETVMLNCLSMSTAGMSVGGTGSRDLLGQTWTNTCPLRILVTTVRTTWSGSARTLNSISANGTVLWSGSANSNATVNISDVEIAGGSTIPVNYYRFNNTMTGGRCYTHTMALWTGSSKAVPSYCLP